MFVKFQGLVEHDDGNIIVPCGLAVILMHTYSDDIPDLFRIFAQGPHSMLPSSDFNKWGFVRVKAVSGTENKERVDD